MSRPALRLPLFLVLPLLSACIDFVEVAGPAGGERPATLGFSIRFMGEEARNAVEIHGRLEPGTDSRSQPRTVANDTLWVMERSLLPGGIGLDASRSYQERWEHDPGDSLVIRFPRVQGVSGDLPAIHWYPPRRLNPDTLVLVEGGDLVLRLRSGEASSDPPAERSSWSLLLRNGRNQLRIDRSGVVPATLVLPWTLLPALEEETIQVWLSVREEHMYETPARDYLLGAFFEVTLDWTVRTVAAPKN